MAGVIALALIAINGVFFVQTENRLGRNWTALTTWETHPLSDRYRESRREVLFALAEHAPGATIIRPFNRYPDDPISAGFMHNFYGLARIASNERRGYSPLCGADFSRGAAQVIEGPFGRGNTFQLVLSGRPAPNLVILVDGPTRLALVDEALLPRNFFRPGLLRWTHYTGEDAMETDALPRLNRDRRADAANCDPDMGRGVDIHRGSMDVLRPEPFPVAGRSGFDVDMRFRAIGGQDGDDTGTIAVRWVALDADGRRLDMGRVDATGLGTGRRASRLSAHVPVSALPPGTHSVRLGASAEVDRQPIRIGSISIRPARSAEDQP